MAGRFVTLASGFDDDSDALPIRADARVLGATLRPASRSTTRWAPSVTAICCRPPGPSRCSRIDARDGAAIMDAAVIKITAIDDSELVPVDTP
jgi:hypothetical protein